MAIPPTRETLLLRIRKEGDERSWTEFVEIYTPVLYGYCLKRGLQQADAKDIVQEVMRSLARALRSFEYDPERGTFRSWLFTVTRREVSRILKKNARQPVSGGSAVLAILDNTPDEAEERDWDLDYRLQLFEWAAARVRSEFNDRHWEAFTMTTLHDRSAEEAADALGMSKAAIYVAKSRIVHRLRAVIHSVAAETWEIEAARRDSR